jgi:hypothetical protein
LQKWEYCILKQQGKQEYWFYSETGSKEKFKGKEHSLARVLIHLGLEGWEAVNYETRDIMARNASQRNILQTLTRRVTGGCDNRKNGQIRISNSHKA